MMTKNAKYLLLLLLPWARSPADESREEISEVEAYTIQQFMDTEQIGGSAFSLLESVCKGSLLNYNLTVNDIAC